MKTYQGSSKSRTNSSISPISTRTRKSTIAAAPPKALRRLQRPIEDDDDDEEEIEEELSPNSSNSSSASEKKRTTEKDAGGRTAADFDNYFIDFDHGGMEPEAPSIFSSVCDRDLDQYPLQSDELDQVQSELEKSLTRAVLTHGNLRSALRKLTTGSGGAGGNVGSTSRSTGIASISAPSANKRKFPKTQQIAKRPPSSSSTTVSSIAAKRGHPGNKDRRFGHETLPSSSRSYYYAQQNHQMPDKFWTFVDQYAAPIMSSDNLDSLRDLIRETDPESEKSQAYYEMPESKMKRRPSSAASTSLSPRTESNTKSASMQSTSKSNVKAKAKGVANKSEQSTPAVTRKRTVTTTASSSTTPAKKACDTSNSVNGTTGGKQNQNTVSTEKNGICLGPLTERLIQALLEECGASGEELVDINRNGQVNLPKNGTSTQPNILMKTLNLGNLTALENRIKKELIEQGLFDSSDDQAERKTSVTESAALRRNSVSSARAHFSMGGQFEECSGDDEVTAELKRRQYELMCLQRSNHQRLSSILSKADVQIEQQRKEENLRAANDEVLNLCSRYYGVAPTSRKPSGKKERDALWKALKEREKATAKIKNQ